jgi:hypothetical protein
MIFGYGEVIDSDALPFRLAKDHVEHGLPLREDHFLGL